VTETDSRTTPGIAPAIWGNVPQRTKNFTGREDILDQLRRGGSRTVTAVVPSDLPHALQGMGGVGKTTVAIEYAYRYRSEYDLVWWIPADQPALVRSSLAALAEPLGLKPATAAGIETAASAVLNALRLGKPYDRWLLIFDNADQPEDLNEIIPRGPGDVLITSRNNRWQAVVETVPVDVFTRTESTDFLSKRVPKGINAGEAARLAEELGDLPIALEQAGALQAETGMSVDEYLRLLREHAAAIMDEGKSPEYPRSMTAAWKLSVSTLNRQLPQAMDLLRCCAFFGPEPIPRDVFRRSTQATGTRVSELLADPILLARAFRELGRFALVKIDGRRIQVHRLIQALLRDELDPAEQDAYRHEVHLILAAGSPKDPDDRDQWPRFAELVAHVASVVTDLQRCGDPAVRDFAMNVVRYLYRSGDHVSSRSFAERFIEAWTQDSVTDEASVLMAQHHLGNALRELGRYREAHDLVETTLQRSRELLGDRDILTLMLANSFGADLLTRGEFARALDLHKESLIHHQERLGPDNPLTLRVMNNLALDYGLNSDYNAARRMHQDTYLLQSEPSSGASAIEVLDSWNGLARAVRLCGDYAEARDVCEEAYDYGQEVLGPEHYLTLRTAKDLSIELRRIGTAYDDALELAALVFELCERQFGPDNPDTLAAAISLTNIQRTTGQLDSALELAQRTVARYPEIYGVDHPYNHGCNGNLALLRRVTGDPVSARQLNETALAGLDSRLTRDHHYSLTVATNLASDLAELGLTAEARAYGEDTLARSRALLGENHPLTLGCATNLAIDLQAVGQGEASDRLFEETKQRYTATLGPHHSDAQTAAARRRLDFDFDPPPI
jgi:tetratricopeptide (TPR) repeat protein